MSNLQRKGASTIRCSMLNVRCSMFIPKLASFLSVVIALLMALGLDATAAFWSHDANLDSGRVSEYEWTTDHMHVGVRWQPFGGRPENNAYDAARPVIAVDSSYAQFWVSWNATEPTEANRDYLNKPSSYLQTIEAAVDACVAQGLKVELVFWHCPAWASESGKAGGWRPKVDHYNGFVTRMATHFKGRVHAYQLYHEANVITMMEDGDIDVLITEIFKKGAQAIRAVYDAAPAQPVIISTSGCSPNEAGVVLPGLKGTGADAVDDYYNRLIVDAELMQSVDALNINVSDHFDGYGNMDGSIFPSTWGNYDLVRDKLDAANYRGKKVLASESWIVWDDAVNANDVNGDGLKNEQDAYLKAITIIGKCLERGLNTFNLPWSDNSSGWAMGLTKRRDYNGRIKSLKPKIVIPASDGGADVVTKKLALHGGDADFSIADGALEQFTIDDYINPPDPNHLHYYIWKWYAQIAGGSDEVIRHAMAGEIENDIKIKGPAYTGSERYRVSSYNRTKNSFLVLIYSSGASAKSWAMLELPATIQNGKYYNNEFSKIDFRGEGFADGDRYRAIYVTKDISMIDGSDLNRKVRKSPILTVADGVMKIAIGNMDKFTAIEFIKIKK